MDIKTVIVFGATGTQGRPQVKELVRQGYSVKAVSRDPKSLEHEDFAGAEHVRADYENMAQLESTLEHVDAVFFQAPSMGAVERVNRYAAAVRDAAKQAGVQLIVVNSSMWAPDEPIGQVTFDGVLAMEEVFRAGEVPVIVFRPTLFMSNLHGDWIKPNLRKGIYRYAHKPDLEADWIALEDVAKFMVAALKRPDLIGRKIHIGGPQRLKTADVVAILSNAMGRTLDYQYVTPRQFGEEFFDLWGPSTGLRREDFVNGFDTFYTFNNAAPQKPFQADVKLALALIPIELTDMRTWAKGQDWS
jgi:uncharacterized protein YbjT (DUF2867 family)